MENRSQWYVVTGGPSSGKKTVLRTLKEMGYPVIWEVARGVIDRANRQGITTKELREDEAKFQLSLLPIKAELEKRLPKEKIYVLNRAMPDSVAYLQACDANSEEARKLCQSGLYKKIFLLEQLPEFIPDYARTEDKTVAERINQLLKKAYEELGYKVVLVPVMSVEERVRFILNHIDEDRRK